MIIPKIEKVDLELADYLKTCGDYVYSVDCHDCHTKHFAGFSSCRSRWCVTCSHKKVLSWLAKFMPFISEWQGNVAMLTLTVQHDSNLVRQIKTLNKGWRRFYLDRSTRAIFKKRFPGGIRSLEVKISDSDPKKWQAHLHILLLQPPEYKKDYEWIKEKWHSATGGSCDIRSIKGGRIRGVIETLKYIVKPEKRLYLDGDMLKQAIIGLRGKRQVNTWGILRGLQKEAEYLEQNWEEQKLTAFVCSKCGCNEGELIKLLYSDSLQYPLHDIKKNSSEKGFTEMV